MIFLLMVCVVICMLFAAVSAPPPHPRLNWLGLGLFLWALKVLIHS